MSLEKFFVVFWNQRWFGHSCYWWYCISALSSFLTQEEFGCSTNILIRYILPRMQFVLHKQCVLHTAYCIHCQCVHLYFINLGIFGHFRKHQWKKWLKGRTLSDVLKNLIKQINVWHGADKSGLCRCRWSVPLCKWWCPPAPSFTT